MDYDVFSIWRRLVSLQCNPPAVMKRLLTALWDEGSRHHCALFGSFLVFLPVRTGRLSEANWANYRSWLGRRWSWSWAGGRADVGSCFHSEGFNVPYLPEFVPSWSLQNSSVVTSECQGAESTLAQPLRYLRVLMRQQVQYLLLVLRGEMPKLREGRAAYETLRLSSISVFWSVSQGEGTLSRSDLRHQAPRPVSSRVRASRTHRLPIPAGSGAAWSARLGRSVRREVWPFSLSVSFILHVDGSLQTAFSGASRSLRARTPWFCGVVPRREQQQVELLARGLRRVGGLSRILGRFCWVSTAAVFPATHGNLYRQSWIQPQPRSTLFC